MNRLLGTTIFAVVGVLALAACGGGDGVSLDGDLRDREFWSTSVIESGLERHVVDGTRIALRFDEGRVSASAGCNSMGGEYEIGNDGTLLVSQLAMTEIGCDVARHDQDQFVATLLTSSPTLSLNQDVLVLTSGDITVELIDRRVADPDRSIIGTEWMVTGFISGDVATSMALSERGNVVFSDESTMHGFDGCSDFTASVEVSDGSIGGPVVGDGEIQFGPVDGGPGPGDGCGDAEPYVATFNALFATGGASYTIDGPNLTLVNDDGNGVTFRAR